MTVHNLAWEKDYFYYFT